MSYRLQKLKRLFFHPDPMKRALISFLYCLIALIINFRLLQVFFIPVFWASIALGIYFIAIIFLPLFQKQIPRYICYFVIGLGIWISIYCLWFLEIFYPTILIYILGILFFGLGLVAFLPLYLLHHTYCYYQAASSNEKRSLQTGFHLGIISFGVYFIILNAPFNHLEEVLEKEKTFSIEAAAKLPKDYLTERVLGVGFKYHTSLNFVDDGWRPPLHDPFFNVFIFLRTGSDYPFPCLRLEERIAFYSKLFPEEPLRISCPCSYNYDGKTYLEKNSTNLISRSCPD